MDPTDAKSSSEARSRWESRVIKSGSDRLEVLVNGQVVPSAPCPPAESLQRRYAASDRSWVSNWLADESDPTQP